MATRIPNNARSTAFSWVWQTGDFGWALANLKAGRRATRLGWNVRGAWVREVDLYNDKEFSITEKPSAQGTWVPFLAMKTADNCLVPWVPSQADTSW